jgi:hypothetical protein
MTTSPFRFSHGTKADDPLLQRSRNVRTFRYHGLASRKRPIFREAFPDDDLAFRFSHGTKADDALLQRRRNVCTFRYHGLASRKRPIFREAFPDADISFPVFARNQGR